MSNSNQTPMDKAYWVGHAIVIICTVLGVYLAATVGFQKAVDLELLKSDRDTFYLAHSFHQEVVSNQARVEEFASSYRTTFYDPKVHSLRLNKYIFETMKFAGSTFELQPEVLNGISNYYVELDSILNKLNTKQLGKAFAMNEMVKITQQLKDNQLVTLASFRDQLREKLIAAGVTP